MLDSEHVMPSRRTSDYDIRVVVQCLRGCLQANSSRKIFVEERRTPHGSVFDQDFQIDGVSVWLLMEEYVTQERRSFLFFSFKRKVIKRKLVVSVTKKKNGNVYVIVREKSLLPKVREKFKHGGYKLNTIFFRVAE